MPGRRARPRAPGTGAGADQPLAEGNWPLLSASPCPICRRPGARARDDPRRHGPRADDFVAATTRAAEAGFDWLELHCAHGYLLSSFISPLTNRRRRRTAAALETACAYPLKVFAAVRAAWPATADVGAHLGARLGRRRHHARRRGGDRPRLQGRRGRHDRLLVGPGQPDQKPVYGRMYQTPFADRIRNEAGIATIAVGRSSCHPRPTTSTASSPRAAPTCAPWPARTWPTRPGR
jgi:anthraniloyl-CoA monooxygenase